MLYIVVFVFFITTFVVLADNLTVLSPAQHVLVEGAPLPAAGAGAWAQPVPGAQRRAATDLAATLRKQLMRNNYDYQNSVDPPLQAHKTRQRFVVKENKEVDDGKLARPSSYTSNMGNGLSDDIAMIKNEFTRGQMSNPGRVTSSRERPPSREQAATRDQTKSRDQQGSGERSDSQEPSAPHDELYVQQHDTGQEDGDERRESEGRSDSQHKYDPKYSGLRYDPDPSEAFYAHYSIDRRGDLVFKTTKRDKKSRHSDKRRRQRSHNAMYARARSGDDSKMSTLSQENGGADVTAVQPVPLRGRTTPRRLAQPVNNKDLLYYVDDANLRRNNRVSADGDATLSAPDDNDADDNNSTQNSAPGSVWDGRRAQSDDELSGESQLSQGGSGEINDELSDARDVNSSTPSAAFTHSSAERPNTKVIRKRSSTPGPDAGDFSPDDDTTDTTLGVTYKLLAGPSMRRRAGRRHNSGRRVLEERRPDGVALVALGGGAPPPVRLSAARRQYMKERHDPRPALADVHLTRHRHRQEMYATDTPNTT